MSLNSFYKNLVIDGIDTALEINYSVRTFGEIRIEEWFDPHGDTPDLTAFHLRQIKTEIGHHERNSYFPCCRSTSDKEQLARKQMFGTWNRKGAEKV